MLPDCSAGIQRPAASGPSAQPSDWSIAAGLLQGIESKHLLLAVCSSSQASLLEALLPHVPGELLCCSAARDCALALVHQLCGHCALQERS